MATIGARTATVMALCVSLAHAGCAPNVVQMQVTQRDYDEVKPYMEPGETSILVGRLSPTARCGIVTCAGNQVFMLPAISFYRDGS